MHNRYILLTAFLLSACAPQARYEIPADPVPAGMPVDLSGSWERDYSRGQDVNAELRALFRRLTPDDLRYPGGTSTGYSARQAESLLKLARFADEITRHDVLTIAQSDHEINVERKEDYAILCEFHEGRAAPTASLYGEEVCGWDGDQLVSNLTLPDGLMIRHRFTISDDSNHLRVTTTVVNSATRVPFSLDRFYLRYDPPASEFNCVETLSMKRVCSTGEIVP